MRLALIALLAVFCLAQRGDGQSAYRHSGQTAYRASVAAVSACAAADAASSWGRVELNPVLAGRDRRFGGRSVAIKAGITGAILGVGWIIQRHRPASRRAVTVGHWLTAGAWCGAAGWNIGSR